jgi:putative addiction module killer protein
MVQIKKSAPFDAWLAKLKDPQAKAKILVRITRLRLGNPGDVKPVGEGVSEMRIDHGPGYRVYFKQEGDRIAILLCGGDKSTQAGDIEKAKAIAVQWSERKSSK